MATRLYQVVENISAEKIPPDPFRVVCLVEGCYLFTAPEPCGSLEFAHGFAEGHTAREKHTTQIQRLLTT